ncbi:GDSL-type esterase/lipase family protein [Rhodopirellula sp. P2]|uniref:GDSL-type esterase/lipase family protein n=1 Tax=Rhodopirellula sp. P2 TaxID=2127060 RepID=UPI0023686FAD|nr:GDSL-type esterase/lipase family protein [Rhodopirellula sp. P2]WDQ17323.1 GDSL-type esterase/lipase family protein [Rhodopirellula sp. P2]
MRLQTTAPHQPHLIRSTLIPLAAWILGGLASVSILPAATAQDASAPNSATPDASETDPDLLAPYREAATQRWEKEIQKYEALDAETTDPADGILLIGSSSIRRWDTAAEDLAPFRVIPRGYGGAKFSDLAVFAERLITPHDFRAVVVFVANDISGKPNDAAPAEVEKLVRHVVAVAREHRPDAPVLLVEITPTRSRYDAWPKIRKLNARLREICFTEPNVHFVATAETFMTHANQPRENLFVGDQLHLNEEGYVIWGNLIRHRLIEVLREQTQD